MQFMHDRTKKITKKISQLKRIERKEKYICKTDKMNKVEMQDFACKFKAWIKET